MQFSWLKKAHFSIGPSRKALDPKSISGLISKPFGACHSKNTGANEETPSRSDECEGEIDVGLPFQTEAEFSYAVAVMDKIGGWEEWIEQEEGCGSRPMPRFAMLKDTDELRHRGSLRRAVEDVMVLCSDQPQQRLS